jgi:hypothetical protein
MLPGSCTVLDYYLGSLTDSRSGGRNVDVGVRSLEICGLLLFPVLQVLIPSKRVVRGSVFYARWNVGGCGGEVVSGSIGSSKLLGQDILDHNCCSSESFKTLIRGEHLCAHKHR